MNAMYIHGEWKKESASTLDVINPATGKKMAQVPFGGAHEATLAVDSAYDAFEAWSSTIAYDRAKLLKKWYELLIAHKDKLAKTMTEEMGKPIKEAVGEVYYAANYVEWYAEQAKRIYGETIPTHDKNKRLQVWKKPVGVVAAITPWNFPAAMLTRKMSPALAAGCPVVIKPSRETPLTAIQLVKLAEKAGFPKGVINLVIGSSADIANVWLTDHRVRKVTFTGSTEVGKKLMELGASTIKKLSLELGGHAPIIVLEDADLDKAVAGTIASKFRNSGQTCVCGNRIYVHENIYDTFVEKLTLATEKLVIGNGIEEAVDIGPLINETAVEKVATHIENAVRQGAQVVTGGEKLDSEGNFFKPTIIKGATNKMLIMQEETFGPVAPVQPFTTLEEVIQLANDTPYGLAAYVFTENVSLGTRLIEQLDFGIVGWNDGAPSAVQAPFGGMKESGLGREGGHQGIEDFLETQYVSIGL